MSDENKALVRSVIEQLFNCKRMGIIAQFYTPSCQGSSPDGAFHDRDSFCSFLERYVTAFPDFRLEVESMVAENDWVAARYTFIGTNIGAMAGFPATGQIVSIPGVVVSRIENHRIAEQVFVWDNLGPRRQIWLAFVTEHRGDTR